MSRRRWQRYSLMKDSRIAAVVSGICDRKNESTYGSDKDTDATHSALWWYTFSWQ
jgi:hypothetical protein